MSKYKHANAAIEHAVGAATAEGIAKEEVLLAMIVASVAAYRSEAGSASTREALLYELGEVEGATDTQFIRSR
jgi:seryl-tRNA synthetase